MWSHGVSIGVVLVVVYFSGLCVCGDYSCKLGDGSTVDWWAIYKYPNSFNYSISSSVNNKLIGSPDSLNSSKGNALFNTLAQLKSTSSKSDDVAYILYSDQPPDGSSKDSFAHSKGILGIKNVMNLGFWITHSIPKYPPSRTSTTFPSSADDNGQTIFCASLNLNNLNKVMDGLLLDKVYIYDNNTPSWAMTSSAITNYKLLVNGNWTTSITSKITSLGVGASGSVSMKLFAKNANWNKELWKDLVAPTLKDNMQVQTWQNGAGGKLNSYCTTSGYDVENIVTIAINSTKSWGSTSDHSKWGVTTKSYFTCFGDINRVESQSDRGGGAVCYTKKDLWSEWIALVSDAADC